MMEETGLGALMGEGATEIDRAIAGQRFSVNITSQIKTPVSYQIDHSVSASEYAREYARRGWSIVQIPSGSKRPVTTNWQYQQFRPEDFGPDDNIGVILGRPSGHLVDIDLDCTEALALADIYLPTTGAEFGRLSKPRSHRLYIAAGATFETFADPLRNNKNTLIEIRAAGRDDGAHQTLFPPSIADNERRQWEVQDVIAPALVEAPALRCRVAWLATGCLVMRYVSEYAAQRPAADFPKLLWEFDQALGRRAYEFLGIAAPDSRIHNLRPPDQLSQDDVDLAEIVHAIPNDCDWESWNAIGMAVFVASGGSDHGRVIFDDFSAKSPKYDPEAVNERWRNYHRSRPTRTGLSKLISLALKAGWRPAGRPVK